MHPKHFFLIDETGSPVIKAYRTTQSPHITPYQNHRHTECELSIILKGRGVFALDNKRCEFHPGDIFLFANNESHSIIEIHEQTELLAFHFEPRILWEHRECQPLFNLFTTRSKHFSNRIAAGDPVLTDKLLALEDELIHQQVGCLINAKYLLFSALFHIIRKYDYVDQKQLTSNTALSTEDMQAVLTYINQHLNEPLTLDALADIVHLTPTYFSTVFKKFNGVSPWKYITIKRVELAIQMLRTEHMTKQEIAHRCGFSSMSNFYSAFTSVTGKTPSDFIKKLEK